MNKKNKIKQLTEVIRKETVKIIEEARKKKKPKFEGVSVQESEHVQSDDIGSFHVVLGAGKGSTEENTMFETDVFNLAEKINSGVIKRENIVGIIKKEGAAKKLRNKMLKERESAIMDAKSKAEQLKSLKGEIVNKVGELKKSKTATEQAVKKLNESTKPIKRK
jgi:hypothetical protein